MKASLISKYIFRIRTRNGVVVDSLAIFGGDEASARQKLRQIYMECEILDCQLQQASPAGRHGHLNYEDVVDLLGAA